MAHHGLGILNRIKIPQLTEHQEQAALLRLQSRKFSQNGLERLRRDLPWRRRLRWSLGHTGKAIEQRPASHSNQQRPYQKGEAANAATATRGDEAGLKQQRLDGNPTEAPQQDPGEQKANGLQVARHD